MAVLSYVPFSAAVAMPVRLFAGEAQVWEPLVALGILGGTIVLIVLLASRVYSGSLLQTGGKVKLTKAWAHAD
jgi:ABC-2 type transport system permease protein